MTRDDFERWATETVYHGDGSFIHGFGRWSLKLDLSKDENGGYMSLTTIAAYKTFSDLTAHYEAERNNLLAVIEKQREALKEALKHHHTTSLPLAIENYGSEELAMDAGRRAWKVLVPDALALTPENVLLVEVGKVETLGGYPDTSQQICYLKKYADDDTKLFTIETIEAKGE